jgi:superfamily I DNA and/or RNA helicase
MSDTKDSFLSQCQKNLIDLTARNNLVNFKFSSPTCFDVAKYSQVKKQQKHQNQSFEIEPINKKDHQDFDDKKKLQKEAHKTLGKTYLKQQEIKNEKGFNPTSRVCYFFKYQDKDKLMFAPIYLIATEVVRNGKGGYGITASDPLEVSFNNTIYEKFKRDFNVILNKNLTDFGDGGISMSDVEQKISEITNYLVDNIHGILIEKKDVIGIFNSAKASLYNELVEMEEEFLNHNLVKIFLSKQSDELNQGELSEDAREIDKISSDKFFSPFDFDSSQLQAIKAAKDGKNFVIQGPPGTGKTQTISNIIAELAAEGKKVLFVAEKKAAIDAVLKNFSKIGLEKIFLDLHDKKSKSKDIINQVIDSNEFFHYEGSINSSYNTLPKLDQAKKELNERSELLHQELNFGTKPFDLIFELSEMKDVKEVPFTKFGNFFTKLSKESFDKCLQVLGEIIKLDNIYSDSQNPFLDKDLCHLKNFIENDKEQNFLPELKSLINDVKSKELKLQDVKNKTKDSTFRLNEFGLNILKFERDDELKPLLGLFQEALPHKNLLDNKDNPWLKMPIKNSDLFDAKEAREILETLQKLLDIKIDKEEKLTILKSKITDLGDGLKKFSFIKEKNSLLKDYIVLFKRAKDYPNIIRNQNQDWLHIRFKNKCFESDKFLEDLVSKFDLLIENIKRLSELDLELNSLSKKSFSLNSWLKKFARKPKIVRQINTTKSNISSLETWVVSHIDLNEQKMLEDISRIRAGKDFVIQNKNITIFKDLQNKIYEAGLQDFFLDTIEKESNFESKIMVLENLYSNRLSLEESEHVLITLDKEVETITRKINDRLFEISSADESLEDVVKSRLRHIETASTIIATKHLIKKITLKIQSLDLAELWQNVWSGNYDLRLIKSTADDYFESKLSSELLNNELRDNKAKIDSLSSFIFDRLDPKGDTTIELDSLEEKATFYITYLSSLKDSIRYLELRNVLEDLSVKEFWHNILESKILPKEVLKVFKKSFYSKVLENLTHKNELIANSEKTSEIISDFKILDKNLIKINKRRIIDSIKKHSSKDVGDFELKELKNRQRFSKPRKVISKYRDIILNSIGCVVCSPLTICEYFEVDKMSPEPIFDAVIFDEASQIFTWDAMSSIFRAKQMIIAGDTQQMPPKNLFASNDNDNNNDDEEGEEDEKVNDYQSLLSLAAVRLRELELQWHYRSKFEQLIHPSNQLVYNGRLISFPNSNKNEKPIVFHYLPDGIWEKQTNDVEAKYLIKLLKEIYQTGARSVGVIAINNVQQTLIINLLYCDDELRLWLDSEDQDGLFIKNLENCQGDERDIIIICSSYAKNKDGKIDGRMFGQINKDDSYKRLNVMFSRAKQKLYFLSSLKWQDIPAQYEGKKGMDFFKSYLHFAETGDLGISSSNHTKQDSFDSDFEQSVCKSLRLLGYEIVPQVGWSGYKIDLAVICPNTKNYILGIECDGEMYHSGKTARERDRLRQEVLESKGWTIHRIWSYDWIHSKKEELNKLKDKIDLLIQKSN